MTRYFCQDNPSEFNLIANVLNIESGRILVDRSPFFPGGGGQLVDRGVVVAGDLSASVSDVQVTPEGIWHRIDNAIGRPKSIELQVDEHHRALQCELHTLAHIINAIVFQAFDGALLTGAQLNDNGTLRMDFDLPGVDNDLLRSLEDPINVAATENHAVSAYWMGWDEALKQPGLFRAKSAAPPKGDDGLVRIVKIGDLDQQACGGTHVKSTEQCRPIRIMKIENKGRQNRRVRVGLSDMI